MKKLLLSVVMLTLCISTFAQNRQTAKTIYDLKPTGPLHHIVNARMYSGEEVSSGTSGLGPVNYSAKVSATQQTIGGATYDLQSNASSVCGRIYNAGNTIGTGWTFSTDLNGAWPDRGTAVNYSFDNGASWGPIPTARVENERRGFGTIDKLGSGEVIISHGWTTTNPIAIGCYYRPTRGSGTWSKISDIPGPTPSVIEDLWAAMRTGGANGNSIHFVALTVPAANSGAATQYLGVDGMLLYYRSTDGGLTWNIQNMQLPDMDSLHYVRVRANAYSIDVRGDVVAIVACGAFDDWVLWKSVDNGTTWAKTVIYDFPFTRYNYDTDTTDVDGDGVADMVPTTDGTCAVVIDNNNVAHCFAGGVAVTQSMGGTANIGFDISTTNSILYWNENMGANPPVIAAQAEDFDQDGTITNNGAQYGFLDGAATMPTAGVDAYNNIYLAFSADMENTDDGNGVNYRNVYACASNDNGATWLPAVNISNDPFGEAVYPCMARDVDVPGCLHLTWQNDGVPGVTANATPPASSPCDILYSCVDPIVDLGIVLGINKNNVSADQIKVSPNPASEFAIINYNLVKAAEVKITIANVLGQSVYQYESNMSAGKNSLKIDLKKFNTGVYTVNTCLGEHIYSAKLVVK